MYLYQGQTDIANRIPTQAQGLPEGEEMKTEQEIRGRLDEITDFLCIITDRDALIARSELIWVLGEES